MSELVTILLLLDDERTLYTQSIMDAAICISESCSELDPAAPRARDK
jgi:hypothetical protein